MKENTVFICENSIDGIFSAIYDAYLLKCEKASTRVFTKPFYQDFLMAQTIEIISDSHKSDKVINTLKKSFAPDNVKDIFYSAASYDINKANAIYQTIALGLEILKETKVKKVDVMANLADSFVSATAKLSRNVWYETHHLMGFLRFEQRGGILFAAFSPKNDILAFLMPHFSDRLGSENFIIFDKGRKSFGIHPAYKSWFVVDDDWLFSNTPYANALQAVFESNADALDIEFAALFKQFCKTVSIEDRENDKLRRNNLPIRFREFMTEFN